MYSLKNIFALLLALFILVSGTNIVFSAHFCSGEISDISLFANKTESHCCKSGETQKEGHSSENQTYINTVVCCSNRVYSENALDIVNQFNRDRDIKVHQPMLIMIHDHNYLLSETFEKQRSHLKHYSYHSDCRDILVLVQSFLL